MGQGIAKETISGNLLSQGWQQQDVVEAFSFVETGKQLPPTLPITLQVSSLPGAVDTLKQAWVIFKQRIGVFLGIIALSISAIILIIAVSVITTLVAVYFSGVKITALEGIMTNMALLIPIMIIFSIMIVALIIIQSWGQLALIYATKDHQEKIGVIESYRRSWNKLISFWWVSFLVGFIVMGGMFLFTVPGIIFSIWFSLAIFVLVAENIKGMDALIKSKEYIKGNWWGVLWRFLFIGILSFIVILVFVIPIFIILPHFLGEITTEIIWQIINVILQIFLTPLIMIYCFSVYNNLKNLKGEIAVAPNKDQKITFISVGILGILGILAMIGFFYFIATAGFNSVQIQARDVLRQTDVK